MIVKYAPACGKVDKVLLDGIDNILEKIIGGTRSLFRFQCKPRLKLEGAALFLLLSSGSILDSKP
jgi:hypothetical protein